MLRFDSQGSKTYNIFMTEIPSCFYRIPEGNTVFLSHNHTRASDGMASPRKLVAAGDMFQQEINRPVTLAITDHDTTAGWDEAEKAAQGRLVIIRGQEITAEGRNGFHKHILALFLDRPIPRGRGVEETIDRIQARGALVIIPHPDFFPWGSLTVSEIRELVKLGYSFDGVEVRSQGRGGKHRMMRALNEELGGRLGAEMGGNDSHFGQLDLTTAFTEIKGADARWAITNYKTRARKGLRANVPIMDQIYQHFYADFVLNSRRLRGQS